MEGAFKELLGVDWYMQTFEVNFHYIAIPTAINVALTKERAGVGYSHILIIVEDNLCSYYYDEADFKRIFSTLVESEKSSPGHFKGLVAQAEEEFDKFDAACEKAFSRDLGGMSDSALESAYAEFSQAFRSQWAIPLVADAVSIMGEREIVRRLVELLSSSKSRSKFSQAFPALTSPAEFSFAQQERLDMLKIALKAKDSTDVQVSVLLGEHAKKYYWIWNNYRIARIARGADFQKGLAEILTNVRDPSAEMQRMRKALEDSKALKAQLAEELGLDEDFRLVLRITGLNGRMHDERKKNSMKGHAILERFFAEMSKRSGVPLECFHAALPDEIPAIFNKCVKPASLAHRMKSSAYLFTSSGETGLEGAPAHEFKLALLKSGHAHPGDIHGLCASPGRAAGTVRIVVKQEDMAKMREGDVLVSPMTRPDIVPAMKKAAAIVTDEGGVTSHAAIISRELGIPCVTGTKVASKVLNDGDLVEVDASHGVVRKVQN